MIKNYLWLLFCALFTAHCGYSSNLIELLPSLNVNNSFIFVNMKLSPEQLAIANTIHIRSQKEYNRFGTLALLYEELPRFLRSVGNNKPEVVHAITDIIYNTAIEIAKATNKETAWVCVRSFITDEDPYLPRWHTDGYYYSGAPFKFAMTLKGPSTLFYTLPHEQRDLFMLNQENLAFLDQLIDRTQNQTAHRGSGAVFLVGDHQKAAVHSEPPIQEERLFFSVLPGNENEIKELFSRWYPEKISTEVIF